MKIALCTTNYHAYSETFIQAHKNLLEGEILYYNTGLVPQKLELTCILRSKNIFYLKLRSIFKTLNLLKYSNAQLGFYHSLLREKPDVILAEFALVGAEIYPIAKRLNIPVVIHCHGSDVSHKPTIQYYKNKYREAFSYASAVIGVSKVMCQKLEELGCPKENIVHSCYGPNPAFLQVQPDYQKPVALAVGRFVDKKAPHLTLKAFSKVLKLVPWAKIRMAGDGPLLQSCKKLVKDLKIADSVTFLGIVNSDQILQEMKSAKFFVQHSITAEDGDMEGAPVGVLEAQAAGLPVIATYHAGIPDIVLHNETGLLGNEGDVDTMANHMIRLFGNINECRQLGEKGRDRIKKYFTMERHIQTLQQVLQKAATRGM